MRHGGDGASGRHRPLNTPRWVTNVTAPRPAITSAMPTSWMPRTVASSSSTDHSTAKAGCDTCSMLMNPIGTLFCA